MKDEIMNSTANRIKYLFKNTIIFALGNIGTKLISFFLVPLYTGYLLLEEYGTVDLVITLGSCIVPLLTFNISEAILRFSLDKDADRDSIMSAGILSLAFMMMTSVGMLPLIRLYAPLSNYGVYACLYFGTTGLCTVLSSNLRGKEKLLLYSIGSILHSFLIAALNIVFLVVLDLGIPGFLLAYILGNFITAIYYFFTGNVIKTIRHFHFDRKLTKKMIKYSVVLIPNSFMWWIMNASNRVLLTAMVGVTSAGLYAAANKLPAIISIISSIFNHAWSYSAIKEDDASDRESFYNQVFDSLFGFVCFAASVLLLFLKPIMSVYVDDAYFSAWISTPPLILGSCILILATFLSSQYTVNKDSKGFLFSGIIGAIVNIVLNLVLIPILGGFGSAIATCLSYIAVFVYRVFDIRKYICINVISVKHVLTALCLLISAISVYIDLYGIIIGILSIICIVILYFKTFRKIVKKLGRRKHK